MLMAPAGHVAVQPVEEEGEGCHGGGGVEVRPGTALQVQHGEKHGADAAGGIGEGEEVREVEAADHREVLRLGSLLHEHHDTGLGVVCASAPTRRGEAGMLVDRGA